MWQCEYCENQATVDDPELGAVCDTCYEAALENEERYGKRIVGDPTAPDLDALADYLWELDRDR